MADKQNFFTVVMVLAQPVETLIDSCPVVFISFSILERIDLMLKISGCSKRILVQKVVVGAASVNGPDHEPCLGRIVSLEVAEALFAEIR